MSLIKRQGYAQVEPNHLSGIVTGQILAQLPVDKSAMGNIIENGRFAKYNYAAGHVDLGGDENKDGGDWMMIYNEEKLYDERKQSHKDFAMVASDYTDGEIVPRLIAILMGDIFTTNAFGAYDPKTGGSAGIDLKVSDKVCIGKDGYLQKCNGDGDANKTPVFQVVKDYTMADGQPGVKLMRIQ